VTLASCSSTARSSPARASNILPGPRRSITRRSIATELAEGNHTLDLAISYLNLGALARIDDRPEVALELSNRSLEYYTAIYGAGHPLLWKAHRNIGNALLALNRLPRARAELEQAIHLAGASLGPQHGAIGVMQYTLAASYLDDEDPGPALPLATAALSTYVREIPDGDPQRADPLVLLGEIHTDRDEPDKALAYRQEVLRRLRHASPEDRADAHFALAETLHMLERHEEARRHVLLAGAFLDEITSPPAELIKSIATLDAKLLRSMQPTETP
jgi:tetratricopeptide (TPR) repeat protein